MIELLFVEKKKIEEREEEMNRKVILTYIYLVE